MSAISLGLAWIADPCRVAAAALPVLSAAVLLGPAFCGPAIADESSPAGDGRAPGALKPGLVYDGGRSCPTRSPPGQYASGKQAAAHWTAGDSKFAIDGWYHTATFNDLSETQRNDQPAQHRGSSGFYVLTDQVLYGLALAYARNGSHYMSAQRMQGVPATSAEKTIELTYLIQVSSWLALQPGLQYVITPNTTTAIPNAWAFQLRIEMSF